MRTQCPGERPSLARTRMGTRQLRCGGLRHYPGDGELPDHLRSDFPRDNITGMLLDELELLREELASLCDPMHRGLAYAAEASLDHMHSFGLEGPEFAPVLMHLTRAHLGHYLLGRWRSHELGGWVVKVGNNTAVSLQKGGLSVRVLRPVGELQTPPPGRNPQRRAFYRQDLADCSTMGAAGSDLIALWNYDRGTLATDIRIVRTIGAWQYGSPERVDLHFILPDSREEMQLLEFVPDDEAAPALPFFEVEPHEFSEQG